MLETAQESESQDNLGELALKVFIQNRKFQSLRDLLPLRFLSKATKNSVDKHPLFYGRMFNQAIRKDLNIGVATAKTLSGTPTFYKAIILKDKQKMQSYFKEFFVLMLDNLVSEPAKVCKLVQISYDMGLVPEDFQALGSAVVTLFRFLTQPIEDVSEDNKATILTCISELVEMGYPKEGCENLVKCIQANFADLQRIRDFKWVKVYKNFSGADFSLLDFPGVNFPYANFLKANLSGAKLRNVKLYRANLCKANLSGAELDEGSLFGSNFTEANLAGANLTLANLTEADLSNADLKNATLKRALLDNANFTEANLTGVNLAGATIARANFRGAVFSVDTVFFNKDTIRKFIEDVGESVENNPHGVLPLLLAITSMHLDKIDSPEIIKLKELTLTCLQKIVQEVDSLQPLSKLFSEVNVMGNIFRYSPLFKRGVNDIFPEVLRLFANTFLMPSLKCKDPQVEQEFKKNLIQEIKKQKSAFGSHNAGWDELLSSIANDSINFPSPAVRL